MTSPRQPLSTLANALGYQAVWFACVIGAAAGSVWPGVLASCIFVAATLGLGGKRREDLRTALVLVPLGMAMDSLFAAAGWISYSPSGPWPMAAPVWVAAIWLSFGMTLNHSLSFLRRRAWLAAALGLVGAPLAYWGASRGFGVIHFAEPRALVLLAIGTFWSMLLPLVFVLDDARRQRLQVQP